MLHFSSKPFPLSSSQLYCPLTLRIRFAFCTKADLPAQDAHDAKAADLSYDTTASDTAHMILCMTWRAFTSIVEQIPHDHHTGHALMAQLFITLRTLQALGQATTQGSCGVICQNGSLHTSNLGQVRRRRF